MGVTPPQLGKIPYFFFVFFFKPSFRRSRGFCAICFSPAIHLANAQTSFGLGGSGAAAIQQATHDALCTGVTAVGGTEPTGLAFGDWLNIQ